MTDEQFVFGNYAKLFEAVTKYLAEMKMCGGISEEDLDAGRLVCRYECPYCDMVRLIRRENSK